MKTSVIYSDTIRELRLGTRRIIHQGGQWSGKTVNILGALSTLCVEDIEPGTTTVTGLSIPHLKGGALRDFETYVYPSFQSAIKKYHRTDRIYSFKSGSVLEFKVFENEIAASGAKRKRLFVNEANSFLEPVFFQLDSRSDQSVLDYNPSIRFWVHNKLIGVEGNKIFYSDHRHNPFISKAKHKEIEDYYNPNEPNGGNRFLVYSRGVTGNISGVIFPDWQMVDDSVFPKHSENEWIYCIDFGYTIDPTCIMKICKQGTNLYVKELVYETGISPQSARNILEANGFDIRRDSLYCERDGEAIKELRNAKILCIPAAKGPGSIKAGIKLLKQFKVFYHCNSRNLNRELSLYVWEKDRKTGEETNEPSEKNNHCFDAIRYGVYTKYLRMTFK